MYRAVFFYIVIKRIVQMFGIDHRLTTHTFKLRTRFKRKYYIIFMKLFSTNIIITNYLLIFLKLKNTLLTYPIILSHNYKLYHM